MEKIQRLLANVCSKDLKKSKEFYSTLFDFKIGFESDWFIHLHADNEALELGIIDKHHDVVPAPAKGKAAGSYLTFVVENADEVYERAKSAGYDVVGEPEDTFYGQRRALILDPDGTLVDVSSPIPDFKF